MSNNERNLVVKYFGEFETFDIPTENCEEIARFSQSEPTVSNELYVPNDRKPVFIEVLLDPIVLQIIQLLQFRRLANDPNYTDKLPELPSLRESPKMDRSLPELTPKDCHELMRKACAALSAQLGFQDADAEALELFVDIVGEKLTEMCEKLKHFHERRLLGGESAFSSAMQQMLHNTGIYSVMDLRHFYDRRVRTQRDGLLAECQSIIRERI